MSHVTAALVPKEKGKKKRSAVVFSLKRKRSESKGEKQWHVLTVLAVLNNAKISWIESLLPFRTYLLNAIVINTKYLRALF